MSPAEIVHDQENHATYISLQEGTDVVARTVEIEFAKVFVDLDREDSVVGIEILGVYFPMATVGP
jgi:uncharacterized protein YuzE